MCERKKLVLSILSRQPSSLDLNFETRVELAGALAKPLSNQRCASQPLSMYPYTIAASDGPEFDETRCCLVSKPVQASCLQCKRRPPCALVVVAVVGLFLSWTCVGLLWWTTIDVERKESLRERQHGTVVSFDTGKLGSCDRCR